MKTAIHHSGHLPILARALIAGLACTSICHGVELRQTSVPVGIINQTTTHAAGSRVSTVVAPMESSSFQFVEWTLNGARVPDVTGMAANPCVFTLNENADAVAIYLPSSDDTDGDTLPDWWERRYFGNLSYSTADNPDQDAFTNAQEYQFSQHPNLSNEHAKGGITRRRSNAFDVIQNRAEFGVLRETSTPIGAVNQTRVVRKGQPITLNTPPDSTGGYRFTGWFLGGNRLGRLTDPQPQSLIPSEDFTLCTARYIEENVDQDSDSVPDWREWLTFNHLGETFASDPDGDGYTWKQEDEFGFSTLAANELAKGGITRRRSAQFYVDNTGKLPFRQTSNPATILEQTEYLSAGTLVTTADKADHVFSNYRFAWWDLNGKRQEDASGAALSKLVFTLNQAYTATANYVDPTVDTDGDGIKDWHEWTYYGNLANTPASDSDDDGFSYQQEIDRGFSPRTANELAAGGVTRRRSTMIFVDTTGRVPLRLVSQPVGMIDQTDYYRPGTSVTLPDRNGHEANGYRFGWWELNGQRLNDVSGAGAFSHTFRIQSSSTAVARYLDATADTDGDGVLDWKEWVYFGDLNENAIGDRDLDGIDNQTEFSINQSPRTLNWFQHGGVSRRRAVQITLNPVVEPKSPETGALFATNISATGATFRAMINPMSAATQANFEYGETMELGSQILSESVLNGFQSQPMDAVIKSLRPNTTYYFRVVASNSFGTQTSVISSFRTPEEYSGYEGWRKLYGAGPEGADDDGDGWTNLQEYQRGTNPTQLDIPPLEFLTPTVDPVTLASAGDFVHFTASTPATGVTWTWESVMHSADALIETSSSPTTSIQFILPGTYLIRVTASVGQGENQVSARATRTIIVAPPSDFVLRQGENDYEHTATFIRGPGVEADMHWNAGARDQIIMGKTTGNIRSLFSFPLPSFPQEFEPKSVSLDLWTASQVGSTGNADGMTALSSVRLYALHLTPTEGSGNSATDKVTNSDTGATWARRTSAAENSPWSSLGCTSGVAPAGDYAPAILSELPGFMPTVLNEKQTFTSQPSFVSALQTAVSTGKPLNLIAIAEGTESSAIPNVFARFHSDDAIPENAQMRPSLRIGFSANPLPIPVAGESVEASMNSAITLAGSPSSDTVSTEWSVVTGPAEVTFGNSSLATTTATFAATGIYTLRFKVSNPIGVTSRLLTVTVVDAMPPAGTYARWSQETWPGNPDLLVTGADADPDQDGLSNFLEWALFLNPREFDHQVETFAKSFNELTYTYIRRRDVVGANFVVEWNDSLSGAWSQEGVTTDLPEVLDENRERITARMPAGDTGKRFVRLEVSSPE